MDRRKFLRAIGLGGVALTLPKPLKVIAAKLADLERPPLHVGYAEIVLASAFDIHDLGVHVTRETRSGDLWRFGAHTTMSMYMGGVDEPILTTTVAAALPVLVSGRRPFISPRTLALPPDQKIEFWFVPHREPDGHIKGKIIPSWVVANGTAYSEGVSALGTAYAPLKSVMLDHARAVQLGLVGAAEPEFDPTG